MHNDFEPGALTSQLRTLLQQAGAVLYRNLVPEHVCLLDNGYACLTDFRFATLDTGSCRTLCGSPAFFAPEVVRGEPQAPSADWWALGVLLYELACGASPWGEAEGLEQMPVVEMEGASNPLAADPPSKVIPQVRRQNSNNHLGRFCLHIAFRWK